MTEVTEHTHQKELLQIEGQADMEVQALQRRQGLVELSPPECLFFQQHEGNLSPQKTI